MKTIKEEQVSFLTALLGRCTDEITSSKLQRMLAQGLEILKDIPEQDNSAPYKLNRDKTVAVSTSHVMSKNMQDCPRGVKVLLLGYGGVLVIGQYAGEEFWQQWQSLPAKAD